MLDGREAHSLAWTRKGKRKRYEMKMEEINQKWGIIEYIYIQHIYIKNINKNKIIQYTHTCSIKKEGGGA